MWASRRSVVLTSPGGSKGGVDCVQRVAELIGLGIRIYGSYEQERGERGKVDCVLASLSYTGTTNPVLVLHTQKHHPARTKSANLKVPENPFFRPFMYLFIFQHIKKKHNTSKVSFPSFSSWALAFIFFTDTGHDLLIVVNSDAPTMAHGRGEKNAKHSGKKGDIS